MTEVVIMSAGDAKALLLTSEMMMKYMGLKLGPALKLWVNAVDRLKVTKKP